MDLINKINFMINFKQIFTWWHKQTFGTFLKTAFFGKLIGKDKYGNKYYKNKQDDRWIVYAGNIDATKITSEWYLWIHHTVNEVPKKIEKNYLWQKDHVENLTGTSKAYKPSKISKSKKNKKYESWKN